MMRCGEISFVVILIGIVCGEDGETPRILNGENVFEMMSVPSEKRNPSPQLHSNGDRVRILMWKPKRSVTFTIPRSSLMISGRGFGPGFMDEPTAYQLVKRSTNDEENQGVIGKRSADESQTMHSYNVPRGGLLVSGRGYMPGFFGGRNELFFVKRSASFERDGEPEEIPEETPENTRRIPQFPRIYRFQRYANLY